MMMKTKLAIEIAALAFYAAIASSANAGTYTDLVEAQNYCAIEGRMAAEVFTHKTIFGQTLEQRSALQARGKLQEGEFIGKYMIELRAGLSHITTEHAAHMDAWARCMDRVRK